jgi:5-formyltetrahydrofolate cyclo-ligase
LEDKQGLRSKMRALRRDHVASLPDSVRALILSRPPVPIAELAPPGSVVGLYHAMGSEAPARGWAKWFLEAGRAIALPWFADRPAPMAFRAWTTPWDDSGLEAGPFKMLQPPGDAEAVIPALVVVPLLAFTAGGDRLGQGAGHYDRWLADHPGVTAVGLGWDCQLVDILPVEPHDKRLAAVVTPTRMFESADR